jgi:hypothetical protein
MRDVGGRGDGGIHGVPPVKSGLGLCTVF